VSGARRAAEEALELIETIVSGGGGGPDGAGTGSERPPAVRVWVGSPDDAPDGYEATRCGSGLFYYDVTPSRFDRGRPPEPDDHIAVHPAGAEAKAWIPYEGPQGGSGWQDTSSGEVVYDDEPPGGMPTVEELREAAEGTDATPEGLLGAIMEAAPGDAGRDPDPPGYQGTAESLGVDISEPTTSPYTTGEEDYPILPKEGNDAVWNAVGEKHGVDAAVNLERWRSSWKTSSYGSMAAAREKSFAEALGLDGGVRSEEELESEGPEVSDSDVAAAGTLADLSREFVDEHIADEDGNFEVHRGLGRRSGDAVIRDTFAALADGETPEEYVFGGNAMTNYTVSEETAEQFSLESAKVTEEIDVYDVVAATDMVTGDGAEGEIAIKGAERSVPAGSVEIHNGWSPVDVAPPDPDLDALGSAMDSVESLIGRIEHDLEHGNDLEYDEDMVEGMAVVAELAESESPDDSLVREEAASALVDEWDGDRPVEMLDWVQDAARDVSGEYEPLQFPWGIDTDEEAAAAAVDELSKKMPEHHNDVVEELTGERFYMTENGHVGSRAASLKPDIEALHEKAEESPHAEKAERVYDVSGEDDWLHGGNEATKAWIPYEGPRGGSGWQDTDTGEVVYGDRPPGETVAEDEFAEAMVEAGLSEGHAERIRENSDGVKDMFEEAQAWLQGGAPGTRPATETSVDPGSVLQTAGIDELPDFADDFVLAADQAGVNVNGFVIPEDGTMDEALSDVGEFIGEDDEKALRKRLSASGIAGVDPDAGGSRKRDLAIGMAETDMDPSLSADHAQRIRDTIGDDAVATKDARVVESLYSSIDGWQYTRESKDNRNRAYCTNRAQLGSEPDSRIALAVDGSSADTITHETAHALAHAYAYDTERNGGVAHNFSDWDRTWDFGGEHPERREMMLNEYTPWDQRGERGIDAFARNGERFGPDELGGLDVGDRVATEIDGEAIEGSVMPNTRPLPAYGELERVDEGDVVKLRANEYYGNEEGSVMGEDRSLPSGAEATVVEDPGDSRFIQVRTEDGFESSVLREDVIQHDDYPATAIKNPVSGETTPLDPEEVGNVYRQRGASERDWEDVETHLNNTDHMAGKAVRYKFGTKDPVEGVVIDETDSQITVASGTGEDHETKTINKSPAYNQSLRVAGDRTDVPGGGGETSGNPPGYDEAAYETVTLAETDVEWDTYAQYEDFDEQVERVDNGDLVLMKDDDGERFVAKTMDHYEWHDRDGDKTERFELDISREDPGPFDNQDTTTVDIREGGAQGHGEADLVGHAEKSQFVEGADGPEWATSYVEGDTVYASGEPVSEGDRVVVEDEFTANEVEITNVEDDPDERFYGEGVKKVYEYERGDGLETYLMMDEDGPAKNKRIAEAWTGEGGRAPDPDGPDEEDDRTDEEKIRDLVAEVNKTWFEMSTKREDGEVPTNIDGAYSETNAHETLAKTHEALRTDDERKAERITGAVNRHPDLFEAYTDIFEPSDTVKKALNQRHERHAMYGLFEAGETPYPEAEE